MTRDEVIALAREAGLKVAENISGVMLVGSPLENLPSIAHIDIDEMHRFAALVAAHEREACIDIVAMHGGSVEIEAAIRSRT